MLKQHHPTIPDILFRLAYRASCMSYKQNPQADASQLCFFCTAGDKTYFSRFQHRKSAMRQEIVVAQKHLLRFVIQAAKAVRLTLAAAACCWLSPLVHAQPYPNKPIRIVVGLAAGGGSDLVARLVGQKLSERLGQPVIVDNKPGTSGIIAAELVAKSPADGYTLMLSPSAPWCSTPSCTRASAIHQREISCPFR